MMKLTTRGLNDEAQDFWKKADANAGGNTGCGVHFVRKFKAGQPLK
jgi:hypothetical protein